MKRYIREPFPALSHLLGCLLAILGLFVLLDACPVDHKALTGCAIYGCSLILLYLASTLTHGVHCSESATARLEQLDLSAIFLLIAGTYTPVCLLIIGKDLGWIMLGVEWLLAAIGIWTVFYGSQRTRANNVFIYLVMGWLFLFALGPLSHALSNRLLGWLIGGGLFYSVGTIFFLTNRPCLFNGRITAHDLWHIFVMAGSICHYMLIIYFVRALS